MKYTAFLSISYQQRQRMTEVVEAIKMVATKNDVDLIIFVDNYQFQSHEAHEMMVASRSDIDRSDFVIAEVSHKAVGVGVEVGYAIGVGKPVIYIRHADTEHSTTIAGISTHQVIYASVTDLGEKLSEVIQACI